MNEQPYKIPTFEWYSKIIDQAQKTEAIIRDQFKEEILERPELLDRILDNLYKKAKGLLVEVSLDEDVAEDDEDSTLQDRIDNIEREIHIFNRVLHRAEERGRLPLTLEQLARMRFSVEGSGRLNERAKENMRELYQKNYAKYPKRFLETIMASFEKALQKPESTFYFMEDEGRVVAFCRFDYIQDEELPNRYFGSVNIDPDYQRGNIGLSFLEEVFLDQKNDGEDWGGIKADCEAGSPASQMYLENFGFAAVRFYDLEGVPSLELKIDDHDDNEEAEWFFSKSWEREEIMARAGKASEGDIFFVETAKSGKKIDFSVINRGYALTRYFYNGDASYALFEKRPRYVDMWGAKDPTLENADGKIVRITIKDALPAIPTGYVLKDYIRFGYERYLILEKNPTE